MLVYVRHGSTSLNKGGSEERLRGWLPVPLSEQGTQEAHDAGKTLVKRGVQPTSFVASDLHRAKQTADIVSKYIGAGYEPDARVRDWNTGNLAGQKVVDVLPKLKELIKNPDEPAPGGEPLNAYLGRFEPTMREKVAAPGIHLVVGHARGATILEGIADEEGGKGGSVNPKFLLERPRVKPGGILIVDKNWNTRIHNPED